MRVKTVIFLCRQCFDSGYVGTKTQIQHCVTCGSSQIICHDALFTLPLAHIDCDAFYCSIEKRENPRLKNKPVIVGHDGRGVVAAACYVARQFGIRSAMPTWKAKKACPDLVIIPPRMALYKQVSTQLRAQMLALTPLVQPLSIDEAFLDLTGTERLHKTYPAIALAKLQKQIQKELGISVSIGLSYNKSMAKIASSQDKPHGFYVIGASEAEAWLAPKPVSILFGLGKTTTKKLAHAGVQTCADLTNLPTHQLTALLGREAGRLSDLARGIDPRPIQIEQETKSISSETTFAQDVVASDQLIASAEHLCHKVTRRLKAEGFWAMRVTLKLKFHDHRLITRSKILPEPTQMAHIIFDMIQILLIKEIGIHSYRLIGVGVDILENDARMHTNIGTQNLFAAQDTQRQKQDRLEQAMDAVHKKLGTNALTSGRQFRHREIAHDEGKGRD